MNRFLLYSVFIMAGCSQSVLSTDTAATKDDTIVREVRIKMTEPEVRDVAEIVMTKTYLYKYDTVGVTREHFDGRWYEVGWKVGDRTYCYCQTGVYMDYELMPDDLLPGCRFSGEKAKTHVIYRVGDSWITVYYKGPEIGNYVGVRRKDQIVLENGIPNQQSGKFDDYHICIVCANPDDDIFEFENMQAYVRFEISESAPDVRDGKLLGNAVSKVTVESLSRKDKMAGDLEFVNDGGWRTILRDRGLDADEVITVIPDGGSFAPSSTTALKNYFVAVPARRYAEGIRFQLYTVEEGMEVAKGYVDVNGVTISRNQILNVHDLLKYCAIFVTDISLKYGDIAEVEYGKKSDGIEIMEGHTGKLIPTITPAGASDRSLRWESSDSDIVQVAQDGSITGQPGKAGSSCWVRVFAKDRDISEVAKDSVWVTVRTDPDGTLTGYNQTPHTNWE